MTMNSSDSFSQIQRRLLTASLLFLSLAYLGLLFFRGFCDPDEGRYAEVPREMVASGNWGEMRMLGFRYYEKPPLAYWMVAPAIAACGARDWAARIPLLLNLALTAALFLFLVRRFWPGAAGRLALLAMLSMIGFAVGFCLLITDGFLTFWFSLTCIALFLAFQPGARPLPNLGWLLLAALAAFLGFLTKGAVAVVLPAGIILIWLAWERRLRDLLTFALPLAALFFLALLTPALLAIERHNPNFFSQFMINEHLARFLGTRTAQLHDEPFWFYLAVLAPLLAPWTLFLARAIRTIAVRRLDPFTSFCVIWVAVVLIFFTISTGKLMSYILPAIPPLALLLGRWGVFEPADGTKWDRWFWYLGLAGLLLAALTIGVVWLAGFLQLVPTQLPPIAGLSAVALIPLGIAFLLLLAGRGFGHGPGALLLSSAILLAVAVMLSPLAGKDFNVLLHLNSSHVFKQLAGLLKPEDRVVVLWDYRPALPFYTQRLTYLYQMKNELEYGINAEPGREGYLDTPEDLRRLISNSPGRVFAVIEPMDYEPKFLPLKLNFAPLEALKDRDTLVFELRPEEPAAEGKVP
jgi:4-amino-4-deoxy-L-arabinose transferase-like glycosyltransferase